MKLPAIATVMVLILSSTGFAGDMCDNCSLGSTSCSLRVSACPQGDFERIADGCGGDSDFIEVIMRGSEMEGIEGIPPTDFWMDACDAGQALYLCPGAFVADAPTDSLGRTTFSGRISAGGCLLTGGLYFACQGTTQMVPAGTVPICLDIVIVSPDLNADGAVNLSDLSFFGQSYNHELRQPEYNPCTDYNDDDWCNLSDFAYFGEHYQHECR